MAQPQLYRDMLLLTDQDTLILEGAVGARFDGTKDLDHPNHHWWIDIEYMARDGGRFSRKIYFDTKADAEFCFDLLRGYMARFIQRATAPKDENANRGKGPTKEKDVETKRVEEVLRELGV